MNSKVIELLKQFEQLSKDEQKELLKALEQTSQQLIDEFAKN